MTPEPTATDPYDDARTAALLVATLDAERFGHPGYLRWFYRENPRGQVIGENEDQDGMRVAHYAVIPTAYRTPAGPTPFIFSTNVATSPTVRRGGFFRAMAERVYERARATGAPGMVGVGNDESTIVVVERFGWKALGPLPVRICPPLPSGRRTRLESRPVDRALLADRWFEAIATDLDWVPVRDWAQSWTPDFLRWRLSRPDGGYVLHVTRDAVAVSVLAHARLRIRAAVLLKVFPRPGAALPVSSAPFVTAACRYHRAAMCVYAGFNAHVRVRGVRPPRRLQPSPLNLVFKCLDESRAPSASFRLDTFEFLDMDAY
ncbi:MAG TPA: GNAT family N-acetyltransferase [Acidimicrobiia bacterium]|jgi:GNAT superfamily N-acetyltransferase|nr:GNAT family N-acetyltransferase [Acidimicrobiia bacterium]